MWRLREWKSISIHAPTRGATNPLLVLCSLAIIFQSTLPREERHIPHHTLYYIKIFQSTLPREERPQSREMRKRTHRFQSTLPREERQARSARVSRGKDFNPRSHERSDMSKEVLKTLKETNFNPRSHERSD